MPIIVNGVTIPTSGDNIIYRGTKVTKVNVVKGGVTTTVWEKGGIPFTVTDFTVFTWSENHNNNANGYGHRETTSYASVWTGETHRGDISHGVCTISTTINTQGCNKCKVTYETGTPSNNPGNLSVSFNGVNKFCTATSGTMIFDVPITSTSFSIGANSGGDTWNTYTMTVKKLEFYYQ